ncbi:helix-turn-helix domain-containing protein, partial [Gordonibacter urolithinfaciens]|uniref:helix-turn-helix domain-containing protein n=2 Tax=Eggerthellales TaxID=1643822 RepID=UPI001D065E22
HDLCKTGGEVFTYENSIYEALPIIVIFVMCGHVQSVCDTIALPVRFGEQFSARRTTEGQLERDAMAICINLSKLMGEYGLSVNIAAGIVKITNVNLSRIRNGRIVALRFSTLDGLIEALRSFGMEDCDVGDIIYYVPESELTDDDVVCYPVRLRDPEARKLAKIGAGA